MWTLEERVAVRGAEEVLCTEAFPGDPFAPAPMQGKRLAAIAEVLCCLPDEDFEKFVAAFGGRVDEQPATTDGRIRIPPPEELNAQLRARPLVWFMPHPLQGGFVHPFPACRLLYLAPRLEKTAWSTVLAVAAHEIAHIVLDHDLIVMPDREESQEAEAWERVAFWGFESEAKKLRAVHKRRETSNRSYQC